MIETFLDWTDWAVSNLMTPIMPIQCLHGILLWTGGVVKKERGHLSFADHFGEDIKWFQVGY